MENPPKQSQNNSPLIKTGWVRAILFFLIAAVFNQAFFALAFLVMENWEIDAYNLTSDSELLPVLLGMIFFQALLVIGLSWVFRRFIDNQSFESLGFSFAGRMKDLIAGFLLGAILMGLGFLILWRMGLLEITEVKFKPGFLFAHFLLFSMVAFQEEIANRGYILSNFLDSMPKYLALFCSAILFGVLHAFNPNLSDIGLANIVLGGILMGIYYVHHRNLWFPIGLHLSWNFVQGSVLGFAISGQGLDNSGWISHKVNGAEWLTGGNFGFEGSLLAVGLILVSIPVVNFVYQDQKN